MRATLAVAATLLLGSTAHGEALVVPYGEPTQPVARPTTLKVGLPSQTAKIARIDIEAVVESERVLATVILQLVGSDHNRRDISLPITIPPGVKASGLELVGVAQGERFERAIAVREYDHTVKHFNEDPALLEWQAHTRAGEQLRLRAYPVSAEAPLVVAMTFELPRERFAIDLGMLIVPVIGSNINGDRREWTNAGGLRTFELVDAPPEAPLEERIAARAPLDPIALLPRTPRLAGAVDRTHSLVAGLQGAGTDDEVARILANQPRPMTPTFTVPRILPGLERSHIRNQVKVSMGRLSHCYTLAAQRNNELAGEVNLEFTVATDGSVAAHGFTGTLTDADLHECLAKEVETWRFPISATPTRIHYPLHFQLRR